MTLTAAGAISADATADVTGTITGAGALIIAGNTNLNGNTALGNENADTVTITGTLSNTGTSTLLGTVDIGGGFQTNTGTGMTLTDAGKISMNDNLHIESTTISGSNEIAGPTTFTHITTHQNGIDVGSGYSGTGISLSKLGAISMDTNLIIG